MAKLSANQQKELFRLVKNVILEPGEKNRIIEKKVFYSIMDSGKVLKKITVKYKESEWRKARTESFGWKLVLTTKCPQDFKSNLIQKGFTLTN